MQTYLVVGLGNPGQKYEKTRHNIGFRILENFLQTHQPGGDFQNDKKSRTHLAWFLQGEKKILLAKPQTFMNQSGEAVRQLLQYHQIPQENLLLIHDDSDLLFGKMKLSENSGSAGHRGVASVIDQLRSQNFSRLRFGIRPKESFWTKLVRPKASQFVLKKFSSQEERVLKEILLLTKEEIDNFLGI